MSDLAFIRDVIYGLKHEYGETITLSSEASVPNLETGEQVVTESSFEISKAVRLEDVIKQSFFKAVGIQKTGFVNTLNTMFLVDSDDLPDDVNLFNFITQNERRLDIVEKHDLQYAMILVVKETQ